MRTDRHPFTQRCFGLTVAALAVSALLQSDGAVARVDPLSIISRQIHQPNILVVLDTSGSLTGVPGGNFDTWTEVGVDCEDGVNCRGGTANGTCRLSGKRCNADAQCRTSTCQADGMSCASDADCRPQAGRCTIATCDSRGRNCQNVACFADADCPPSPDGTCTATGATCSPDRACSSTPRCEFGNANCSLGTPCPPYGHCLSAAGQTTTQTCSQTNDCPLKSAGTCVFGGEACTSPSSCGVKLCPDRNTICTSSARCGVCSKGTSSLGTYCERDSDCTRNGARCEFSAGSCSSLNNKCDIPHYECRIEQPTNACRETNTCQGQPNTCQPGPANRCIAGGPGDVCDYASNSSGAIGMCRITQLRCQRDADCPASGDSCGPATSRFVIAKRVLADVVNNNHTIVNFGFMTFYQSLYFPYYAQQTTGSETRTAYLTHGRLNGRQCFTQQAGPAATCVIDGITYSLRATNNSRYTVRGTGGEQVDAGWCGFFCDIPGKGTGNYRGSYYTYTVRTGNTSPSPVVRPTYTGKQISIGGTDYRYYDSNPAYYNGGDPPPIEVAQCWNSCSAKCGARWDTQLAPFLDPTGDLTRAQTMALAISDRLASASYGGLISYGGTPIGCTLRNDSAQSSATSAYHYMRDVKAMDTLSCRDNFVLLITDGEANGPGDMGCGSAACGASNPRAAGCSCRAVLAAYDMRQNLGVRTLVVGFSGDVATGTGRAANDNIAKAGGTDRGGDSRAPYAFVATNEGELIEAIQDAIYDAVKGSYATSPPTMSSGVQQANGITSGSYALDARADFPSWKGHLLAFDTSVMPPTLVWDAATELQNADWKSRRVYTSDSSNRLVKITVDGSGNITNRSALHALGLGANEYEAGLVARWLLGDPAQGNPAPLGAIVNSTPIDVGQPGDNPLPGGRAFFERYKTRPRLTYVGADDGLLHAFWSQDQLVGGVQRRGGSEAFAYLPPQMLPVVTRLYAQGGQLPDPRKHIYGLASSPKVKNLCTASCSDPERAIWKTVLVMTDGFGGTEAFALDITDPTAEPPIGVLWTTAGSASRGTYDAALGLTISVPAFTFNKTSTLDDHRLILGSGYRPAGSSGGSEQGRSLLSITVGTGAVQMRAPFPQPSGSCVQEHTVLSDVATAKDYTRDPARGIDQRQRLLAAYAGDTWGNLWRMESGSSSSSIQQVAALGCEHPLHFAPTVVQLDRDDPNNHPHEIYLVQVTNSALDDVTRNYQPSRMVFMRDLVDAQGNVYSDTAFGTGGQIVLKVGEAPRMCAITDSSGTDCLLDMPLTARPMATPLAVLKADGSGFLALSTWYVPADSGCGKGTTYMQIHQYTAGQTILKQAMKVGDEPVSAPIVVGGKIMVMTSQGPVVLNGTVLQNFTVGQATPASAGTSAEPFKVLGWTELP